MKKPRIMFDKTEIIAYATIIGELNKKSHRLLNLTPEKFSKISFLPCVERRFFSKKVSEKIVLHLRGYAHPIEFTKRDNLRYFNDYKTNFEKFAKYNNVSFLDETK